MAEGQPHGTDDNLSWNCGAEGPTVDSALLALRRHLVKNHACALLFSCGTPMILGGDEFLRSQGGNNNAYCQDNAMSWHDWTLAEKNADILAFFRKAIAFTKRYPALQRRGCSPAWARTATACATSPGTITNWARPRGMQSVKLPPLPGELRWHHLVNTSLTPGRDFRDPDGQLRLARSSSCLAPCPSPRLSGRE